MATVRRKSVQYGAYLATAADATNTDFPQISIELPEDINTVQDCIVEIGFQDNITATGGTITTYSVAASLDSGAYQTITETDDIVNSGENISVVMGPFSFTGLAWGVFGGTHTLDLRINIDQNTGTTLGFRNLSALVTIVYEANDIYTTRSKTVRIPIGGAQNTLPTTKSVLNSAESLAIPQLTGVGGILPENSVTILDYFFVIEGNENTSNNTTDFTLNCAMGSEATFTFQTQEAALGSDRFCRWIYKPTAPPTDSNLAFYLWATGAARLNHCTVTLYVTYKYSVSGTTRVLNSLLLPLEIASPLGSTTSANASRFSRDIIIPEPGTITLRQSGVKLHWNAAATPSSVVAKFGSQSYQTFVSNANVSAGMYCLQFRFDPTANAGSGITLVRGRNTLTIDAYCTNANNQITNISGYIILNYESDVATDGPESHNTTLIEALMPWDGLLQDRRRFPRRLDINETNYWFTSVGFELFFITQTAAQGITFDVACLSGEGKGGGYYDIYADAFQADNERSCSIVWMRGRDVFKRCPQDADSNRLSLLTSRDYRLFTSTTGGSGVIIAATYHSITWTISGNISGNNVALPTYLSLVNDTTDEIMQVATLGAGTTAFSFTVYDNTENYYVTAYQDGTYLGRSATGTAS